MTRAESMIRNFLSDLIWPEGRAKRKQEAIEIHALFHQLWSAAGTPSYDKAAWNRLQQLLQDRGISV